MAKKRIYYTEFRRDLERKGVNPVYFFTGAESFLKEEGIRAIVDKSISPEDRSMNFESLYAGTDVSGREIVARASTLPFMAERRVLVVRQAEKWRAGDLTALMTYLADPSPAAVLIISSAEERIKQANWKAAAEKTYHVECYPLFDNQVPAWVEHRASEHGKRITREAVMLLIERVGQSLADIDNELGKLINYTAQKSVIESEDILATAGHTRQNTIHELNTALGRGDARTAMAMVSQVTDEGFKPPQILGAIAWHFRNMLASRVRIDNGEDLDKVLIYIRNPQARKEMQTQLQTYPQEGFNRIFQELVKLDEGLKSGKGHWEMLLEMAILKICSKYTVHALNP
ncbi:DNA polymerase III subunit delta [bacterium]|nr:DNA polymerase III subunit delta [bacterium]